MDEHGVDEQEDLRAAVPGTGTSTPAGTPARSGRTSTRWAWLRVGLGVAAGGVALTLLVGQLGRVDLGRAVGSAEPTWLLLTLLASVTSFVGAAATVTAVSPVRLRPLATLAVQVAGNFVNLLGPAGLGGMALNARYLNRRGAKAPAAVAAVAAVQVLSLVATVGVVAGVVVVSGRVPSGVRLLPGGATIVAACVVVVLVAAGVVVAPVRRWVVSRAAGPARQAAATVRALVAQPARLVAGLLGSVAVTSGFVLVLELSLRSYGVTVPVLELVVVLLAGTAVGSVFPVPGGAGTVEAAVAAGLVAVGVDPALAVLASVTYRTATLWVWVVPGWLLVLLLRRSGDV